MYKRTAMPATNREYGRLKRLRPMGSRRARKTSIKLVRDMIIKAHDKHETPTYITGSLTSGNGAYVQLVNGIAQGTSLTTRIANKLTHHSLEVTSMIYTGSSVLAGGMGDCGFMAIVLDRQSNGAGPPSGFAGIYDITNSNPGLALRNSALYPDRFLVLKREDWTTGCYSDTVAGEPSGVPPTMIRIFVDLEKALRGSDKVARYEGNTGGIGDIVSGALYVVLASNVVNANLTNYYQTNIKYKWTE